MSFAFNVFVHINTVINNSLKILSLLSHVEFVLYLKHILFFFSFISISPAVDLGKYIVAKAKNTQTHNAGKTKETCRTTLDKVKIKFLSMSDPEQF